MEADNARYDQVAPDTEARVENLVVQMTLADKVGQLVQIPPYEPFDVAEWMAQEQQTGETDQTPVIQLILRDDLDELIRTGKVGSLVNISDPREINYLQSVAVEQSRLGIPLLIGSDVIHGFRTIFPIPLAESSTWDPALLERASRVAAEEASASGIDWIFAPMVDIARDPRWGRIAESAGEDPYLGMAMARARVRGFQSTDLTSGRRIVACPKHYVGYGAAEAGRDYNTVDVSERTLRDVYLPPFKAAFDAGAGSVMSAFNDLNGIPATANPLTLRTILREEWAWAGVVLSDYDAVKELIAHGLAANLKEAVGMSILAGLDMDMASNAFADYLEELVIGGEVSLDLVDEAVRRVLRLKYRLGLFEHPYVDEDLADKIILRDDFRALALKLAQESMVLLKNEGDLLPLSPDKARLAVIGPLADNRIDLLGSWALNGRSEDVETVVEGLRAYLKDENWIYEPGCPISEDDPSGISSAVAAALSADLVILVLGESADMSGEAHSRVHLGLPGRQQDLADAIAETGKPMVCVLMSGRPLVIPRLAGQVDALLVAWHGGIRAGRAVADLIFGATTPSGKLTASWPRAEGQIPVYYASKNTGRPAAAAGTRQFAEAFKSVYLDEPNSPLFPFGFGLSYTRFEYRDLQIEQPALGLEDTLIVTATIANTGERAGDEIVQLYVRDLVGSITRPVKELKGFQKISLQPGEARTIRFEIPVSELGFTGRDLRYTVEPGDFKVWIGPDSTSGQEGEFLVL
jgi:beta-glucosidase